MTQDQFKSQRLRNPLDGNEIAWVRCENVNLLHVSAPSAPSVLKK